MLRIAQSQMESITQDRPDELLRSLRKRERIIRRIDNLDASFRRMYGEERKDDSRNDEMRNIAVSILAIDRQCSEKASQRMTVYKADLKSLARSAKQLGAYANPFDASRDILRYKKMIGGIHRYAIICSKRSFFRAGGTALRIKDIQQIPAGSQRLGIVDDKRNAGGFEQEFQRRQHDTSTSEYEKYIRDLTEKIHQQGKLVSGKADIAEFQIYRALITELLNETVSNAYAFCKTSQFDARADISICNHPQGHKHLDELR
jgi:uncharacterized protein YaaR (DUF327 family)